MKKFFVFIRLMTALAAAPLCSEEITPEETPSLQQTEEEVSEPQAPIKDTPFLKLAGPPAGATKIPDSSSWKSWAVAGGAIVTAVLGIVLVATNSGGATTHE